METQIIKYVYEDQEVEFDLTNKNLMVNATEMAKIFKTDVGQFLRTDDTKRFIQACLKPAFLQDLGIKNQDDLYVSRQRSGTWMHRVLALKFAAWLDSNFEVWVYLTIDQILQTRGPIKPESIAQRRKILTERNGWLAQKLKAQERIQTSNEADTKIIKQAEREIKKLDKQLSALNKTDTTQATLFAQEIEE